MADQRAQELDELFCFVEERYAFRFELDELDKNPSRNPRLRKQLAAGLLGAERAIFAVVRQLASGGAPRDLIANSAGISRSQLNRMLDQGNAGDKSEM